MKFEVDLNKEEIELLEKSMYKKDGSQCKGEYYDILSKIVYAYHNEIYKAEDRW